MSRQRARRRGVSIHDFVILRQSSSDEALLEVVDLSTALSENNVAGSMKFFVDFKAMAWTCESTYGSDTRPIGQGSLNWQASWQSFRSPPSPVLGVFNRHDTSHLDRMVEHALRIKRDYRPEPGTRRVP